MVRDTMNIFVEFLKDKNLNFTKQRESILRTFLKIKRHLSVDEFYEIARKVNPHIGHTTVFRALKLFCEAGIAKEVDLGERLIRYELKFGHKHHDHLVCTKCGRFIEVVDQKIEYLQDSLCKKFGFLAERHRMEIFGICKKCKM